MTAISPTADSGFAIHEDVFSATECEQLLDHVPSVRFNRGRAGTRHLMSHPDVRRIASDPRMLRIARASLGADALPYRATLFDKSGAANWSVVWHQDTALPLQSKFDLRGWGPWSQKEGILYSHAPSWALSMIVALRLHLDASTADNGPLRILRGTHALGVMSDEDVFAMARSRPHVDCVVGRGGVMAMYPLLVHSSGKGRSGSPRRVLHIEYATSLVLAPGIQLAIA
ncbi:MAG TPA: phytanoyl-CoA dioxygenase family protein [Pyrinomonadaceae bacterium]|nr:phytanoyl-CoA dioxygenase family protein [Pyrinomonadaceae bacterium]